MPMMARSMLVTNGSDEEGQTYLDGEECGTGGCRNLVPATAGGQREATPRCLIVEPRSPESSSSQEDTKERRCRHDCCDAYSLDPATHRHTAAVGSLRSDRDHFAGRLIGCPGALVVPPAQGRARAHSDGADVACHCYRGLCVIGSSPSSRIPTDGKSKRARACIERGRTAARSLYIRVRGSDYEQLAATWLPKFGHHGYNALSSLPRLLLEVRHANQGRTPRIRLLSRSVANAAKVSRRRLMSNGAIAPRGRGFLRLPLVVTRIALPQEVPRSP
jgi:hypothetical protein